MKRKDEVDPTALIRLHVALMKETEGPAEGIHYLAALAAFLVDHPKQNGEDPIKQRMEILFSFFGLVLHYLSKYDISLQDVADCERVLRAEHKKKKRRG